MSYLKYLKYKIKYLNLKQFGGVTCPDCKKSKAECKCEEYSKLINDIFINNNRKEKEQFITLVKSGDNYLIEKTKTLLNFSSRCFIKNRNKWFEVTDLLSGGAHSGGAQILKEYNLRDATKLLINQLHKDLPDDYKVTDELLILLLNQIEIKK